MSLAVFHACISPFNKMYRFLRMELGKRVRLEDDEDEMLVMLMAEIKRRKQEEQAAVLLRRFQNDAENHHHIRFQMLMNPIASQVAVLSQVALLCLVT